LNKPVLLEDVFRGGIIDEEPEGWWSALRGAGGQTAWFDLRHELASKHFKKSSAQDAVKISRGAKSGELDPQGIFMSLLSDEQSMAIALVALVGEAKRPMVMGVVLRQGEVDLWPDHMRTPALCGIRCWMEQKQLQIRPAAQVDPEPDSSTVTFGSGLQPLG
jgi:hypothetical protein